MENTIQQISGKNAKDKFILALVVKRTYTINDDGSCILDANQIPLHQDVIFDSNSPEVIAHDSDLYYFKPYTDIVVKGKARSVKKVKSFMASVEIAKAKSNLELIGNRKVYRKNTGALTFDEPESIAEIPLTYQYAYGGKDLLAEKPLRDKIENDPSLKYSKNILEIMQGSPYRYPRNPLGKGYVIEPHAETLETLELPNIEDPNNKLTPNSLICKSPHNWHRMPVPVCTDWVSPGWFPRIGYYGLYDLPPALDENIYEIKNGWADLNVLQSKFRIKEAQFNFRFCNGASLGLQTNYLQGGEQCRLTNIHPNKKEFVFQLPKEQPQIKVDGRNGKLLKTAPNMHSVIIEPDQKKLSIVWCGSATAIRPYFEEELKMMPFEVKWRKI